MLVANAPIVHLNLSDLVELYFICWFLVNIPDLKISFFALKVFLGTFCKTFFLFILIICHFCLTPYCLACFSSSWCIFWSTVIVALIKNILRSILHFFSFWDSLVWLLYLLFSKAKVKFYSSNVGLQYPFSNAHKSQLFLLKGFFANVCSYMSRYYIWFIGFLGTIVRNTQTNVRLLF